MRQFQFGILVAILGLFHYPTFGQSQPARIIQHTYKIYTNARFDYEISYPADLLTAQGEAENGDGQKFLSSDGRAILLVYGSHNSLDQSLRAVFLDASTKSAGHPNRIITYKIIKADWFVVSGIEDGTTFYQKTLLKNGVFKTFRIQYPESLKRTFDEVTTKIEKSFRG